jgi:hypothetical protein
LTAKHVIDEVHLRRGALTVGLGTRIATLIGDGFHSVDPSLDVFVVPIVPELSALCDKLNMTFLPVTGDLDERIETANVHTHFLSAFPASKTWTQHGRKHISAKSYSLGVRRVAPLRYPDSLDPETHLLFEFDQDAVEDMQGQVHRAPSLKGSSGGGMFEIANPPRLVGIFTEHHADRRLLVATRIDQIVRLICQPVNGR